MALASAVLRSSAQNGIGRREQTVLSNLFLITNQNKCYLLFLIRAHKKKQTVAPSVRGTATTTKQPMLLLLRFQIIQSTLPYYSAPPHHRSSVVRCMKIQTSYESKKYLEKDSGSGDRYSEYS